MYRLISIYVSLSFTGVKTYCLLSCLSERGACIYNKYGSCRGFIHSKKPAKATWTGDKDNETSGKERLKALQGVISVEGVDHNTSSSENFGDYYR